MLYAKYKPPKKIDKPNNQLIRLPLTCTNKENKLVPSNIKDTICYISKLKVKFIFHRKLESSVICYNDELYSFDLPFSGCITLQHILQF